MTLVKTAIEQAITKAQDNLFASQHADGSWDSTGDMGPMSTAQVLVALHWLGALSSDELHEGARWLRAQQRPDGSFEPWPCANHGELGTTASAWAALTLSGTAEDRAAADRARTFIDAQGGLDKVVYLIGSGDVSAWYLAFAGLLDPDLLPAPPLLFLLSDGALKLMQSRVHMGMILGAVQSALLTRYLKNEWGAGGPPAGSIAMTEVAMALDLLSQFLNADGSENGNTPQTALMLCTFRAAGLPMQDDRIARNVRWLRGQMQRDAQGLRFDIFSSNVWCTAFDLRALLASGVAATDPRVMRATQWLVDAQLALPQPAVDNRHPLAPRTGGYAFQRENFTMADCDDAGVVLSPLGMAHEALPEPLRTRVKQTFGAAKCWLDGMQNPDGGWAAFVYGLGHKPPGPAMTTMPHVSPDNYWEVLKSFIDPPLQYVDAATEDVTSRVLHGLGSFGLRVGSPEVDRGLEFLRAQQCESGAFWGRWICNYLPTTAFVLLGATAVGENPAAQWLQRAADWMLSCQNDDGGWGENVASYTDPALAGQGPSTAPMTGIVLAGLVASGLTRGPAVEKAVGYLLAGQRADGVWDNGNFLVTNVPPTGFYLYLESAKYFPLEALGRLRATL